MDYNGEPASDGQGYVHVLEPPPLLVDCYTLIAECEAACRADIPGPEGALRADAFALILAWLETAVEAAGETAAQASEAAIKARIVQTMVRPRGTGTLESAIVCKHVQTVPPTAEIGVADVSVLDETAVGRDGQPYWKAQDLGSDHLVGKAIHGYFQPGDAPADVAEFRNHPIFEPDKTGPQMLVQRPIPARHFIEAGREAADLTRHAEFLSIQSQLATMVKEVSAGTHPFVDRVRKGSRYRRPPP